MIRMHQKQLGTIGGRQMLRNETSILKTCLLSLGRFVNLRVWRNNTGSAWMGKAIRLKAGQTFKAAEGDMLIKGARPVKFGLPGSGDIVGVKEIFITPEMAGTKIGQFVSLEIKTPKGIQSDQQLKFQKMVRRLGGKCEVARNADEAVQKIMGDGDA